MIRNSVLTLISLIFCALAIWMLSSGDAQDRLTGAGCLAFFGGCAIIGAGLLRADLRNSTAVTSPKADESLALYYDRWFHLAFGVASWGMSAGAVIFAMQEPAMWLIAIPALVLFGLGGGELLTRALDRAPVVIIDAQGVLDRRIMSRPAPWSEIKAAGFAVIGPVQHLQLIVDDAPSYRRLRKGVLAWFGRGSVTAESILIAFQGLDGGFAQALAAIGSHKPEIMFLGDFDD